MGTLDLRDQPEMTSSVTSADLRQTLGEMGLSGWIAHVPEDDRPRRPALLEQLLVDAAGESSRLRVREVVARAARINLRRVERESFRRRHGVA